VSQIKKVRDMMNFPLEIALLWINMMIVRISYQKAFCLRIMRGYISKRKLSLMKKKKKK
jgi:hypothetical protein